MNKIKRSEKFCPQCKGVNPIRSFFCKNCQYSYPQKDNPKKKLKEENKSIKDMMSFEKKVDFKSDVDKNKFNEKIMNEFITHSTAKELSNLNIEIFDLDIEYKNDELHLKFHYPDMCERYASDYTRLFYNGNLFAAVSFYSIFHKKMILTCLELSICNDSSIVMGDDSRVSVVKKSSILIEEDEFEINKYSLKILDSTPILLYQKNNTLAIYVFDKKGSIRLSSKIIFREFLNLIDCIITTENIVKIIASDYNNTIFLYNATLTQGKNQAYYLKVELISLYEKYFSNKITDLKFIPIKEEINENKKLKNFFGATSRDGLLLIFDTLNPLKYVYKHKTTELWITRFIYSTDDIIYYTANCGERIVAIQFSTDDTRSPVLKRIPNTENVLFFYFENSYDRLYFSDLKGEVYYINGSNIREMFACLRKRAKFEIYIKNIIKAEDDQDFVNFKVFSLLDDKKDIKNIIVLPCLDKIVLKTFL